MKTSTWSPPAGSDKLSLTPAKLAELIKSMADAFRMAGAIENLMLQIELGVPLMSWRVESIAGCARFTRFDDSGTPQAAVAAVNAPESRRAEYDRGGYPYPHTILMVG